MEDFSEHIQKGLQDTAQAADASEDPRVQAQMIALANAIVGLWVILGEKGLDTDARASYLGGGIVTLLLNLAAEG